MRVIKKIISLVLVTAMVLGLGAFLPAGGHETAYAADSVSVNSDTFPDLKFRMYVSYNFDKDSSGGLSVSEIEDATYINFTDFSGYGKVASLKGIEHLTNLRKLICSGEVLETADLRWNTKLDHLNLSGNRLTSLYLGNCPYMSFMDISYNYLSGTFYYPNLKNIHQLYIYSNQYTGAIVSTYEEMTEFVFHENNFNALDISHNPELRKLSCYANEALTEIDVSKCPELVKAANGSFFDMDEYLMLLKIGEAYNDPDKVIFYSEGQKILANVPTVSFGDEVEGTTITQETTGDIRVIVDVKDYANKSVKAGFYVTDKSGNVICKKDDIATLNISGAFYCPFDTTGLDVGEYTVHATVSYPEPGASAGTYLKCGEAEAKVKVVSVAPKVNSATYYNGKAYISFSHITGAKSYEIYMRKCFGPNDPVTVYEKVAEADGSAYTATIKAEGLIAGFYYEYAVLAVRESGAKTDLGESKGFTYNPF